MKTILHRSIEATNHVAITLQNSVQNTIFLKAKKKIDSGIYNFKLKKNVQRI